MAQSPLSEVEARIAKAAALAGRKPDDVTLIAVSKTQPAEAIEALIGEGQRDFGENRVQEAQAKWPALRARHPDVRLHLVGRLQSNKAEEAVALFDAIHSLDRPSLVAALGQGDGARPAGGPDCFIQVNIGDEPQKGGCPVAELPALLEPARGAAGRRPDVHSARGRRGGALFRLARQAGAASWRRRPVDGHVGRFRDGGDVRRHPCPRRHRLVRAAPMRFEALIFDFDGVLLESEWAGNKQIADYLTGIGHPTSVEESMNNFMGLAGLDFLAAIERWIGRPVPDDFHDARAEEDARALAEGVEEVAGAVAFIRVAAAGPAQGDLLVELDPVGRPPPRPSRPRRRVRRQDLLGARACRARQAGARSLSPRRRRARRADRPDRDHRGFAGRRRRRASPRAPR